jgi:hypothetical protein
MRLLRDKPWLKNLLWGRHGSIAKATHAEKNFVESDAGAVKKCGKVRDL